MRTRNRRGMLLLVVLALLAMFAMLAVAFVVMTGSERGSAENLKRIESQLDPPAKTLDAAAAIAAHGGTGACPIQSICLMEKIYGADLTSGTINANGNTSDLVPVSGGQLLTLKVSDNDPMHKIGCTLTMMTGQAAGLSTKIVGLVPVQPPQPGQPYTPPSVVEMLPFEGNVMPQKGDQYIINGFPYGGMGFGYDPSSGTLGAQGAYGPLALEPRNPLNLNPVGGANPDYTAPDNQDPLLAYATPGTAGSVTVPIPSLHRADLIQHWMAMTNKGSPLKANQMRLLCYRPLGQNSGVSDTPDHPNFTGSNPNFNPLWDGQPYDANGKPVTFKWDVDNMGRGTPDSVWVDLGFPVRFTPDGRAYKPLFAILCLDLDGRLNVNAHGALAQTQPNYYQVPSSGPAANAAAAANGYANVSLPYPGTLPGDVPFPAAQAKFAGPAGAEPQSAMLVRGQGGGPAEVNLTPLTLTGTSCLNFLNPTSSPAAFNPSIYQALLAGAIGTAVGDQLGRYGEKAGSGYPGTTNSYSLLNWNRWFSYSDNWMNDLSAAARDAWGSPPDPQGFGAVGLDVSGKPIYLSMGGSSMNSPYDTDLSRNAARATGATTPDSPFSVAELERILRSSDRDATTLPTRLLALTSTGALSSSTLLQHSAEITTDSYSVPVAPAIVPAPLLSQQVRAQFPEGRTRHPVDAPAAAMLTAGGTVDWGAVADLLPWEMLQGLKMNVNRPFGGGARSTGGNIQPPGTLVETDQPTQSGEYVGLYASSGTKSEQFYYDGSGYLAGDSLSARQLYAKHLYALMMMSADLAGIDVQTGSRENTARLIAQWAVNVVAYRDHNSIMIPFSYDVYPFGDSASSKKPGWVPKYDDAHTVWGCKRPELLITETLAFHDRRTEDTSNEVIDPANRQYGAPATRNKPAKTTDPDPKQKDPNFDQHYRPQGSLFVELYNPWTAFESQPADLLLDATGKRMGVNGVNLSQVTPGNVHSPVWRLIIVDPTKNPQINGELRDPDDPVPANRPTIERAVYFVPSASITTPSDVTNVPNGRCFFASAPNSPKPPVVLPGGYAVIGSGESSTASPNRHQTLIGLDAKSKQVSSRTGRYITLDQGDLASNPYVLRNNVPLPPTGFTPPAPVTVVVDTPHRLSVSEPVGGYGLYEHTPKGAVTYSAATEVYSDTIDIPFDFQRSQQGDTSASKLVNDGTYTQFRIIYLQRLADPTRQYNQVTGGNLSAINAANPYRTIDAMPVDLTAFNGVIDAGTNASDPNNKPGATHFEARQRGNTDAVLFPTGEFNLWKQESVNKTNWANPGTTPTGYFNKGLTSSLGYLNVPFYMAPTPTPTTTPIATSPMSQASGYQGGPPAPFPWLNWAYRPFVNEYELLLVPAVSSSKLLARNEANPRKYYAYVNQSLRPGTDSYDTTPLPMDTSFPHLLAMFQSESTTQKQQAAGQFHRVLAYLGVPTPFAHFTVQANPDYTGAVGQHWFHQPFNGIPTYREPGRINLNTISSSDVFMGMLNFQPGLATQNTWTKFFISRSGDPKKTVPDMTINAAWPSRFMHPFRSAGGAWLTPPLANGQPAFPSREINATLMREDPTLSGRPLLQVDDVTMNTMTSNAGGTPDRFGTDVAAYQPNGLASVDFNRSPYFRYQGLQKLAGVATTHSNVFAIWITVGYFEVTPATAAQLATKDALGNTGTIYPDGYQLGEELGADTGDVVRHRAFYIFDRSLPVGYIRGQDVNTAKAFLLQRYIE